MRTLVTGASGHIGNHLVRELLARGHEVTALVRPTSDPRSLHDLRIRRVLGDVLEPASLAEAAEGAEVVFHAAANFSIWSKNPADILRPSIEGTRNVIAAAARAGAKRIVHTSSCVAMGFCERADAPLRTERDWRGESHVDYYRAKTDGERAAVEAAREHALPIVTLCPTLVLGARDFRVTPSTRMLLDLANGSGPTVDGGANVVGAADVARAHVLAAERGRPGERYLVGGENLTLVRLGELVAACTGRAPKHVAAPRWVFHGLAAFAELGASISGKPPSLTRAAVRDVIGKYAWFDVSKAREELGFEAAPAAEVVRETIAWLAEQGRLTPAVAAEVAKRTPAAA
jgi:dihydroflavonol-4-reductase